MLLIGLSVIILILFVEICEPILLYSSKSKLLINVFIFIKLLC